MVEVRAEFLGKPNHSRLVTGLAEIWRSLGSRVMTLQILGNSGVGVSVRYSVHCTFEALPHQNPGSGVWQHECSVSPFLGPDFRASRLESRRPDSLTDGLSSPCRQTRAEGF